MYDFGKSARGIYTLALNVEFPKDAKMYIGAKDAKLKAKVMSRITVDDIEIGVADREKSLSSKATKWDLFALCVNNLILSYWCSLHALEWVCTKWWNSKANPMKAFMIWNFFLNWWYTFEYTRKLIKLCINCIFDKYLLCLLCRIQFPGALKSELEADFHQKIIMKFTLKELSGAPTTVHQAFIRLTHKASGREIFFVAQAEDNVYKFSLVRML